MNCREAQALLDDHLDGRLADPERARLDDHLATCAACRREAEGLRSILEEAATLPRSIRPARDLWPAVSAEIGRRKTVEPAFRRGRMIPRRARAAGLAAAAVALVALSSAVTAILLGRGPAGPTDPPAAAGPAAARLAAVEAWEAEVVRAAEELASALAAWRETLAPETVALLEANLRIIDEAIRESRAALERDPGNAALGQMLRSTYRRKLELLQQATRLYAET